MLPVSIAVNNIEPSFRECTCIYTCTVQIDKMFCIFFRQVKVGILDKVGDKYVARQRRKKKEFGGVVSVGPLDINSSNIDDEIREAAIRKFSSDNESFDTSARYTLVYANGEKVENNLPDGSAPFTLKGYKRYLGAESYARIRLYLFQGILFLPVPMR